MASRTSFDPAQAQHELAHADATPARTAAGAPARAAGTSPALAQIQAVRSSGWTAVEEIAAIARTARSEWPAIATWLQDHRGNGFVQEVLAELAGTPSKTAKLPIVLLHGFNTGPGDGMSFADAVKDGMRGDGALVFEVTAPPFQTPAERAKAIAPQLEQILRKTGASKLNLIAHSLGGLDARFLISSLGWADRIASLSTLGTPHHGTPTADLVAGAMPAAAKPALDSVGRWVGKHVNQNPMAENADVLGTVGSMTSGEAKRFNAANPDRPGVYYQSWAGLSTFDGGLDDAELAQVGPIHDRPADPRRADRLHPALYLGALTSGGLNDGAVPVDSARWGNYRGAVMGDHFDLIGQDEEGANPRTGFDPAAFYRQMARDLGRRGF
ncbi:MAG: triacylglycerol lipase [Kofleriaceae bacterium]|nr:triacylglycerol lipase [Kofleriaceae bacterium]